MALPSLLAEASKVYVGFTKPRKSKKLGFREYLRIFPSTSRGVPRRARVPAMPGQATEQSVEETSPPSLLGAKCTWFLLLLSG